jgi:hypothetical protein
MHVDAYILLGPSIASAEVSFVRCWIGSRRKYNYTNHVPNNVSAMQIFKGMRLNLSLVTFSRLDLHFCSLLVGIFLFSMT